MSEKMKKALETRKFLLDMIADARKEHREFDEDEQKLFDEQKNELIALSEELKATEDKLDEIESELPEIKADEEEKPQDAPEAPQEPEEKPADEEQPDTEETPSEEPEKPQDEEEEKKEITDDVEKINNEDEGDDPEKEKDKRTIKMKNDFSFIKAIRSVVDGTRPDDFTAAVLAEGTKSFRDSNLSTNGQIQIPLEKRVFTVTTAHDDVIETEFDSLLTPLYANRVLGKARWYNGLVGDLQIPVLEAGEEARWEGETTASKEITNGTDSIKLTPHRLSVETKISKQMLVQDSIGVEQAIREDLINNLYNKLENTFLSDASANGNVPAGIFAGKTVKAVTDYKSLCELECDIEEQNFNGPIEYVFSPAAKASFRQMTYNGGRVQRLVMENGEIDGTPFASTTNVKKKYFGLLNWDSVRIGQWAGLDLVVDPYTLASNNQVKLVLNAYFDCKLARPELVEYGTIDASLAG